MACRLLCALLFLAWTAEIPGDEAIYCALWRSPFALFGPLFVNLPGIGQSPWQLLLAAFALFAVLRPGAFRRRPLVMDAAIFASLLAITLTFLWGFIRGGSAYNAYYQLWRLLTGLLVAFVLPAVVRDSRHLKMVGATVLAAALVRGCLAIYFYWGVVHGEIVPTPPHMTTHDDSLLFVGGILILIAWALMRKRMSTWILAGLGSALIFHAMALNGRRLAWIELLLVLGFYYLLLPQGKLRRRVTQFALVMAPVVALYVAVGWGRSGPLFEPLRALSTSGSDQDASSLARLEEIRNLMYTLSAGGNPVFGTGWGMQYQKVTSVYANFGDENWWQYRYLPHNSLLGVTVFGGFVGMFGIWMVVPVAAFLATRGYRQATSPIERAAGLSAVCILPAYGVQCYGDIGLQSFTCALILGVALGVAGKVSVLADHPVQAGRRRPSPFPQSPTDLGAAREPGGMVAHPRATPASGLRSFGGPVERDDFFRR